MAKEHDTRRRRRPFQVDLALTPEHRAEYEAFLADGRNTGEKAVAWLKERGYKLSWGAVWRHRNKFLDELHDVRRWARVAGEFSRLASAEGRGVMADATLSRFEQMFMQSLWKMEQSNTFTPRQWAELAATMAKVVSSREQLEEMRSAVEQRQRRAVALAKKKAAEGADGRTVVDKVREILGV